MEEKINLPDKATIKSWISQGLQPSQFLLSLAAVVAISSSFVWHTAILI
jgi:hypothetical protein